MTSALTRQVGGAHYVRQKIQPVEFAMVNGLDPCAFSILKYVSRHRAKGGLQDIEKALHFRDLRHELLSKAHAGWRVRMVAVMDFMGLNPGWRIDELTPQRLMVTRPWIISPETYCAENEIHAHDRSVIVSLGRWLEGDYDAGVDVMYGLRALEKDYKENAS